MKIVDTDNLGSKNDKVFFGNYSGFQRYDAPTFSQAVAIEEKMRCAYWNPSETSLRNDAVKFHVMPHEIQGVLTSIWFYQTLMDSAQSRGLEETINQYVTNPEWEAVFKTWGFFEMIHSISYSHIIRGIFVDSTRVFEENFNNRNIIERVQGEIDAYSYIRSEDGFKIEDGPTEDNIKKILELIMVIYALEGIKFYASFLITYLIHDRYACIPGACRIIKLINFDEDWHTRASVLLLKNLKEDPNFNAWIDLTPGSWFDKMANRVFDKVRQDEKNFADYLISIGGMELPVSGTGVHKFLDYYSGKRLKDIGLEGQEIEITSLVEWFDMYKDLNKENIAMQESDLAVYNIGVMQDDM